MKNTANQEPRQPLHILRYCTNCISRKLPGVQHDLHVFPPKAKPETGRHFSFTSGTVKITVMQCFLFAYREYPTQDLIFCIHTHLKARKYNEKSTYSWDISRYATRKNCISSIITKTFSKRYLHTLKLIS